MNDNQSMSEVVGLDWIVQCFKSPPTQHMVIGDSFYRSKDPTNSIKVLKDKSEVTTDGIELH